MISFSQCEIKCNMYSVITVITYIHKIWFCLVLKWIDHQKVYRYNKNVCRCIHSRAVLSVWKGIGSIQFTVQTYMFACSVHRYRYKYIWCSLRLVQVYVITQCLYPKVLLVGKMSLWGYIYREMFKLHLLLSVCL